MYIIRFSRNFQFSVISREFLNITPNNLRMAFKMLELQNSILLNQINTTNLYWITCGGYAGAGFITDASPSRKLTWIVTFSALWHWDDDTCRSDITSKLKRERSSCNQGIQFNMYVIKILFFHYKTIINLHKLWNLNENTKCKYCWFIYCNCKVSITKHLLTQWYYCQFIFLIKRNRNVKLILVGHMIKPCKLRTSL